MKKILFLLVLMLCTFCLFSCDIFKELKEGMQESNILIEDFCSALANDDLETAKTFLHPDSTPKRDNLSSYIEKLETTHSIDFSLGVAFKSTTGFSSTYYDSIYDGSVHEASYKIVVGGVSVKCFFTVVKNDNGYGLYSFGIEK